MRACKLQIREKFYLVFIFLICTRGGNCIVKNTIKLYYIVQCFHVKFDYTQIVVEITTLNNKYNKIDEI